MNSQIKSRKVNLSKLGKIRTTRASVNKLKSNKKTKPIKLSELAGKVRTTGARTLLEYLPELVDLPLFEILPLQQHQISRKNEIEKKTHE